MNLSLALFVCSHSDKVFAHALHDPEGGRDSVAQNDLLVQGRDI